MSTGTDVITDVSTTHQTLSSHDTGMYTSVLYVYNKLQLLSWLSKCVGPGIGWI